ncbi:MAG: hypothetical protein AVDCRST_MAG51-866, partial [uncultured Ramlibacter sp.]
DPALLPLLAGRAGAGHRRLAAAAGARPTGMPEGCGARAAPAGGSVARRVRRLAARRDPVAGAAPGVRGQHRRPGESQRRAREVGGRPRGRRVHAGRIGRWRADQRHLAGRRGRWVVRARDPWPVGSAGAGTDRIRAAQARTL